MMQKLSAIASMIAKNPIDNDSTTNSDIYNLFYQIPIQSEGVDGRPMASRLAAYMITR